MVFHLGVLLLAERGALERVIQILTIFGGSLLVGLMLYIVIPRILFAYRIFIPLVVK